MERSNCCSHYERGHTVHGDIMYSTRFPKSRIIQSGNRVGALSCSNGEAVEEPPPVCPANCAWVHNVTCIRFNDLGALSVLSPVNILTFTEFCAHIGVP